MTGAMLADVETASPAPDEPSRKPSRRRVRVKKEGTTGDGDVQSRASSFGVQLDGVTVEPTVVSTSCEFLSRSTSRERERKSSAKESMRDRSISRERERKSSAKESMRDEIVRELREEMRIEIAAAKKALREELLSELGLTPQDKGVESTVDDVSATSPAPQLSPDSVVDEIKIESSLWMMPLFVGCGAFGWSVGCGGGVWSVGCGGGVASVGWGCGAGGACSRAIFLPSNSSVSASIF